jgi:hypothetical protein
MWTELAADPRYVYAQPVEAVTVHITNSSEQPVYDLVIGWHKGTAPRGKPDEIPASCRASRKTGRIPSTSICPPAWTGTCSAQ